MSKRTQPVKPEADATDGSARDVRAPYEAPRLMKKRSVSRVTLFIGSGATGTGVTGP